jgi:hypothetical protein
MAQQQPDPVEGLINEVITDLHILESCGFNYVIAHDFDKQRNAPKLKISASGEVTLADLMEAISNSERFKKNDEDSNQN